LKGGKKLKMVKENVEVSKPKTIPEVKTEETKDGYNWQPYGQPELAGLVNKNTGEFLKMDEAIIRILCFAEEAAKNTR